MAPGRAAIKASVLASPCRRLTAPSWLAARRTCPGVNRFDLRLALAERQPFRAASDNAAPDQPERGRADDAEQRRPPGDEGQIDGEFVAAGDEFLGAVQGVDQEKAPL